jgi:hypothetical protein
MKQYSYLFIILMAILNIFCLNNCVAQCNNSAQYPSSTVPIACGSNTISFDIYAGEYSVTKGYIQQSFCTFTSSIATDYITIRKASNNDVIAFGVGSVSLTYFAAYDSLEMHINTNASCGNANIIRTASVFVEFCGCENPYQFPSSIVGINCGSNTILPNQYTLEYNVTSGYKDQSDCLFSSSVSSDHITLRKATDNSVLAQGFGPLYLAYQASYGNIEMHINKNSNCATDLLTRAASVEMTCGCNTQVQNPSTTFNLSCGANTITTTQQAGQYNLTSGYQDRAPCIFASSVSTDYITLRRASDNVILASGLTPLNYTYQPNSGSIEMHITANTDCHTQASNRTATVMMDCTCTNIIQYPANDVILEEGNNIISYDQWAGDYAVTTSYDSSALCVYTSSISTDLISLRREGSNALISSGYSPLDIEYHPSMGKIRMHINTNITCGIQNLPRVTTVFHQAPSISIVTSAASPINWSADTDMKPLASNPNIYQLAAYVPAGILKFRKYHRSNINWGGTSFPSGTASLGGANIMVPTAGYYNIQFNTATLAYTFTPFTTVISIIGSATPAGMNFDTNLIQDVAQPYLWKSIMELTNGTARFRQDQNNVKNWGSFDFPQGIGLQDGANINVSKGTYAITFDYRTGAYMFDELNIYKGGKDDGFSVSNFSQSDNVPWAIYKGGIDDGFSQQNFAEPDGPVWSVYRGGVDDGFSLSNFAQPDGPLWAIYKGGIDDGFDQNVFAEADNPPLTIYRGGIDDGFDQNIFSQADNPLLAIYKGGVDDGFEQNTFAQMDNALLAIYKGGIDDGYTQSEFSQRNKPPLTIYAGGIDDGFDQNVFAQADNPVLAIFKGGIDDGFDINNYIQCDGNKLSWMGSQSTDWHTAVNWECGILPTINSDVTIPSNSVFFPRVSSNYEIKSLHLKPGSAIEIIAPAILKLNGM